MKKLLSLLLCTLLLLSLAACGAAPVEDTDIDPPPAVEDADTTPATDDGSTDAAQDGEGEAAADPDGDADTAPPDEDDADAPPTEDAPIPEEAIADSVAVENVDTAKEAEVLTESPPAVPMSVTVSAPGTAVQQNDSAIIDYSNASSGYVMVQFTASTSSRLKVQVVNTTTYTYNLKPGRWEAFPLSDGSGSYQITIYQNVVDSKYAAVLSASVYASDRKSVV